MIEELFDAVEKHTQVSKEQLKSKKRQRDLVFARMYFAFILRNYTNYTLFKIGKILCKDHSTILHYLNAIEDMIACEKITNKHSMTEITINKILTELETINESNN